MSPTFSIQVRKKTCPEILGWHTCQGCTHGDHMQICFRAQVTYSGSQVLQLHEYRYVTYVTCLFVGVMLFYTFVQFG